MKNRDLIAKLQMLPMNAEILTDNIGFTKLEPLKSPELQSAMLIACEYLPCRDDEKGAVQFIYIEAPGV